MVSLRRITLASLTFTLLVFAATPTVNADELIVNGGFETGTFAGWNRVVRPMSTATNFFIDNNVGGTPVSGGPTVGPRSGSFYAVSDQSGPGTVSLLQTFVVPAASTSVILSFDMFVNNFAGAPIINPIGLDHTSGPNQHGRVDILTASAGAFDTGAGVLANYYLGADLGPNPHPYIHYTFDITSLVGAGGTFQLRFAETDNQLFFNLGVDNVSINTTAIPEPATMILLGTGLAAIAARVRRRRQARCTGEA
ncbi:MAG: PEP-CTERM sorting domain-containing protein [Pyrinomonadaceae bacterium]|nr:PEP-CTERM sorting domain-containing protein [Pyrinomonadaceae bacterium]